MLLRDAMSLVRVAENAGAVVPALRRAEKVAERIVTTTSHDAMISGHIGGNQAHSITTDFDRLARNFIEAERAVGAEGSKALKPITLPIDNARIWAEHGYRVMHEHFVGALPPAYIAEIAQKPASYRVVTDQLDSLHASLQSLRDAAKIDSADTARVVRDADLLVRHSDAAEAGIRQALSSIGENDANGVMEGISSAKSGLTELRRSLAKAIGTNNPFVKRLDADIQSVAAPEVNEQTLMKIVSHWDVKELVSPIADARNALLGVNQPARRVQADAYSPAAANALASRHGLNPLADLSPATLPPVKEGVQVPEKFRHLGKIDLN